MSIDPDITVMYAFRFVNSDKLVHLNQQQLESIPYLFNLVTHKDDFITIQNENGEYVLNTPIDYNCFLPILYSITCKKPYTLFNELPTDENILDIVQLFDYLGIDSFALPLLKDVNLVRLNPIKNDNEQKRVEFSRASLPEARNTAAEFLLALIKNEYDLHDSNTVQSIFSLMMIIFSHADVFSSRFRHHTLTIVKEYCFQLFSKKQQDQLPTRNKIARNSRMDSWIYLYEDDHPLPENFKNIFAWKGVHKVIEKSENYHFSQIFRNVIIIGRARTGKSTIMRMLCDPTSFPPVSSRELNSSSVVYNASTEGSSMIEKSDDKNFYINEGQLARSGRFNTLPKRPKIDKFKHRSGPKAQKYR